MRPDIDPDEVTPPFIPYTIMRLGKVKLLPFFLPGDPGMGEAVRGLASKRSAVLLANHGPVVAGKTLDATVYAMEKLAETAKLAILTRSLDAIGMIGAQVAQVVKQFNVDYD